MRKIPVLLGPTCIGKTSLALEFCKGADYSILSADSRQIIKYMDFGTGKIPVDSAYEFEKEDKKWKVRGITIHGYDLVTPTEYFSAYDYAQFGNQILDENKRIIVVGGTGFYVDILTGRIKPDLAKPDLELRRKLESLSLDELQTRYLVLSSELRKDIDMKNKARLIRALEKSQTKLNLKQNQLPDQEEIGVSKSSGHELSNLEFKYFGLNAPNELLYARADLWLESVWDKTVNEVRWLIENGYETSVRLQGLVYKSVVNFIDSQVSESEAKQRAKFDLHSYIRRQKTYFKKNKEITCFDITDDNSKEKLYNALRLYE